jgi:Xaa-Pro aminopeptidase
LMPRETTRGTAGGTANGTAGGSDPGSAVPFDLAKLQRLMEEERIDLLLASSRHNVRYLTGGYHYHFHANSTRMGRSRYIPFVGIPARGIEEAFYIHRKEELDQMTDGFPWIANRVEVLRGTDTTAQRLVEVIRDAGLDHGRLALELPFLPADVFRVLQVELPHARLVDGTALLEELRMIKSAREIEKLQSVYDRVAEAIQVAFARSEPGDTTERIERRVRLAMAEREINFLFALICAGPGFVRPPSPTITWETGRMLHIDAGGEEGDYIGDVCRMGYIGKPSALANELHGACLQVQDTTRGAIRPGVPVREILRVGMETLASFSFSRYGRFVVHGIGMVPHEQPYVTPENGQPLEEGMVLSVETDFLHPDVGHLKIEDSVVVTADGCEGMGDLGREWHIR